MKHYYGALDNIDQTNDDSNEKIVDQEHARPTRIGIRRAIDAPWRFCVPGNPHVSKHRGPPKARLPRLR